MDRRSSLRPVAVLERSSTWPMPNDGADLTLMPQQVFDQVMANAGCRLPLSNPALDSYDQALRAAQLITGNSPSNVVFPDNLPTNDGNPGIPTLLLPLDNATGVSTNVTLTWSASDETDCYQILFGTSSEDPPAVPGCITANQWQTPSLQPNTTYYWQIIATDSCNHLSLSPIRSFTTGS